MPTRSSAVKTAQTPESIDLKQELALARKAALEAGGIIRHYFHERGYKIDSKSAAGHSPVTTADLEADRALKKTLRDGFPHYGWLSEETADNPDRLKCERVWIVDPLDGTHEFIRGIPEFVVAIALVENSAPILGVTYNPIKREMYWAARGMGCHLGRKPVRVSRTRVLSRARVLASRSETARGEWREMDGKFNTIMLGSVAYKLALVASGQADATFTRSPKSEWDIASGAALVAEAGGRMTDIHGDPIRFNKPSVKLGGLITTNAILYPAISEIAIMPRRRGGKSSKSAKSKNGGTSRRRAAH